ncbi:MAG TPA: hypothetical protein PLP48_02105 [Acholeplasmataceae bacterium]|jgi:hypothetical protein|nr:hypothetical protein [Acholeplasmataceae bacterium]
MKSKQDMKLIAQIIQELSLFVMYHGYESFDLSYARLQYEETYTLVLSDKKEDMLTYMEQKINQKREKEIEAYYWELLGDLDSSTELNILGLIIDYMSYSWDNDKLVITLHRSIKE